MRGGDILVRNVKRNLEVVIAAGMGWSAVYHNLGDTDSERERCKNTGNSQDG